MQSPVLMINEAGATHRPDTPPPRPRGQHTYENRRERERDDGGKKEEKNSKCNPESSSGKEGIQPERINVVLVSNCLSMDHRLVTH